MADRQSIGGIIGTSPGIVKTFHRISVSDIVFRRKQSRTQSRRAVDQVTGETATKSTEMLTTRAVIWRCGDSTPLACPEPVEGDMSRSDAVRRPPVFSNQLTPPASCGRSAVTPSNLKRVLRSEAQLCGVVSQISIANYPS